MTSSNLGDRKPFLSSLLQSSVCSRVNKTKVVYVLLSSTAFLSSHPTNMTAVFRPYATALITGGGSGIGFAVAQLCRSHGMNLILVDIHAENLAYAHTILGDTPTAKTLTHVMDVGDLASWEYLSQKVGETFPNGVDLLMLNAGASFKPRSPEMPWGDPEYFQKVCFRILPQ